MTKKKLWRKLQCSKCPWKVTTDPRDIPNGYCETKHQNLSNTIAVPGLATATGRAMACHESTGNEDEPFCIGWLFHQLGPGNSIGLRMRMREYDLSNVRLVGKQHKTFEDTLPKES